ncbi:MAG: pantetheine-phosphate adenylyltransferase [Alphaproteobacteria bacterium]|nr:pantetheine-phosphate adenylyltransferase [Alphaproteobacteria bacterium]MDE2631209.1 pantetheine-phosphate adenylyltransferase [Alphaproteobacteria bacterium]
MAKTRIALYPGTFDPLTLGHLDIVERAVKLVDHLIIGVASNPAKAPMFSHKERVAIVRRETKPLSGNGHASIAVQAFDQLLIEFAEKVGAGMIVRGLRAVSDFEYEFQMVGMNQRLNAEIETVFLMADPRHQAIASRLVKEIAMLGGDVSSFTSPHVAQLLVKRCQEVGKKK